MSSVQANVGAEIQFAPREPALIVRHWDKLALLAIIGVALWRAALWAWLVPIYQSPDEPVHLDYALCISERGGLFRATEMAPTSGFPNYKVHPYTFHLLGRSDFLYVRGNFHARVKPDYGTRQFYQAIDDAAPSRESIQLQYAPSLVSIYPFGYYALLGAWISVIRFYTDSVTTVFFGARLLSVGMLGGTLCFNYATLRALRVNRWPALGSIAVVGCLPITSFIASYIQPDNLSWLLSSATLYYATIARRDIRNTRILSLLGLALGGLLVTKLHYFACVAGATGMTLASTLWAERRGWRAWVQAGVLVVAPSVALGAVHLYCTSGVRNPYEIPMQPGGWLGYVLPTFQRALQDFYFGGTTYNTFWSLFGWCDYSIVLNGRRLQIISQFVLQAGTLVLMTMGVVSLAKSASRLVRWVLRGRWRQAVRAAFANPLVIAYLLFTGLMLTLYVRMNNFFGAQGRNWLPLLGPSIYCAAILAPRMFTLQVCRRWGTAIVLTGLLTLAGLGQKAGLKAVESRYYPPCRDAHLPASRLSAPVALHQVVWKDSIVKGQTADAHAVFTLPQPTYVHAIRFRCKYETGAARWVRISVATAQQEPDGKYVNQGNVNLMWKSKDAADQVVTAWVEQPINLLRIDLGDNEISELELLLPSFPAAGSGEVTK